MSEERCPKCGNTEFGVVRDGTSRRVCSCGERWMPPKREDELQAENDRLIRQLVIVLRALEYYADENEWRGHWFKVPLARINRFSEPMEFNGYQIAKQALEKIKEVK